MNNENEVVYLYLDDIIPNRFQPREVFDDRALKELAVSIKEHGVIQPIIVRKIGSKYEIIAGERRYKASTMAGLTKIPAIIKDMDDKESSKVALIENLQRKDLTPIEEARTYQKILDLDEMTQEDLARTMGKSQSAISNKLRLLSLPEEVQDALLHEEISERHARSLLNLNDSNKQVELLRRIISSRMTVRDLDKEIKSLMPTGIEIPKHSIETPKKVEEPLEEKEIIKQQENLEFLGGVNDRIAPLSKPEEPKRVTDNMFIKEEAKQQPINNTIQEQELIGGNTLPGVIKPEIKEQNIQVESLLNPQTSNIINQEVEHDVDTIEILDLDSNEKIPRIIPLINNKQTFTNTITDIKNFSDKLKREGHKIEVTTKDENGYYQVIFNIKKD